MFVSGRATVPEPFFSENGMEPKQARTEVAEPLGMGEMTRRECVWDESNGR